MPTDNNNNAWTSSGFGQIMQDTSVRSSSVSEESSTSFRKLGIQACVATAFAVAGFVTAVVAAPPPVAQELSARNSAKNPDKLDCTYLRRNGLDQIALRWTSYFVPSFAEPSTPEQRVRLKAECGIGNGSGK
jgi:hypothetical protein